MCQTQTSRLSTCANPLIERRTFTDPQKTMRAATNGLRYFISALFILAVSCAAVRAEGDGVASPHDGRAPIDGTSDEQPLKQTCKTFYRLDDVTELNDEIRRCLIPPGGGTAI